MYGIGFFVLLLFIFWDALENFVFLKKYSTGFQKNGFIGKYGHPLVCPHPPLSSFYLTPLSAAFEKVWGDFWTQFFELKKKLLEKYTRKSAI